MNAMSTMKKVRAIGIMSDLGANIAGSANGPVVLKDARHFCQILISFKIKILPLMNIRPCKE